MSQIKSISSLPLPRETLEILHKLGGKILLEKNGRLTFEPDQLNSNQALVLDEKGIHLIPRDELPPAREGRRDHLVQIRTGEHVYIQSDVADGRAISLSAPRGKIDIAGETVDIRASQKLQVKSLGETQIDGRDKLAMKSSEGPVQIEAQGDLNLKSQEGEATIEARRNLILKGGEKTSLVGEKGLHLESNGTTHIDSKKSLKLKSHQGRARIQSRGKLSLLSEKDKVRIQAKSDDVVVKGQLIYLN